VSSTLTGAAVAVTSSGTSAAAAPAQSIEKTFFQQGDTLVTNTRFVKGNSMWPMSGVTSVSVGTEVPSKKGPIALVVIGGLILLVGLQGSGTAVVIGLGLVALGIWWLVRLKNSYHILLMNAATSTKAISDTNRIHIDTIVNALTEAVIHRG
jgi:hypothetical protein